MLITWVSSPLIIIYHDAPPDQGEKTDYAKGEDHNKDYVLRFQHFGVNVDTNRAVYEIQLEKQIK
jgi:hypothetical protein